MKSSFQKFENKENSKKDFSELGRGELVFQLLLLGVSMRFLKLLMGFLSRRIMRNKCGSFL